MKKSLMTLGVLALFVLMAYGQEKKFALYSVAFYNMENLFDTIHDEGKNDYEYLPNGTNQWNTMKFKYVKYRQVTNGSRHYRRF